MSESVVNIADVIAGAEVIDTRDLAEGHYVFDAFGQTHRLDKVRRYATGVRTVREDGWSDWWPYGQLITVKKES